MLLNFLHDPMHLLDEPPVYVNQEIFVNDVKAGKE